MTASATDTAVFVENASADCNVSGVDVAVGGGRGVYVGLEISAMAKGCEQVGAVEGAGRWA